MTYCAIKPLTSSPAKYFGMLGRDELAYKLKLLFLCHQAKGGGTFGMLWNRHPAGFILHKHGTVLNFSEHCAFVQSTWAFLSEFIENIES